MVFMDCKQLLQKGIIYSQKWSFTAVPFKHQHTIFGSFFQNICINISVRYRVAIQFIYYKQKVPSQNEMRAFLFWLIFLPFFSPMISLSSFCTLSLCSSLCPLSVFGAPANFSMIFPLERDKER